MKIAREGRLSIELPNEVQVDKIDEPGRPLPKHLKLVDFVLDQPERQILLELKDPWSTPPAHREASVETFLQSVRTNTIVDDVLVPKARGTYLFLHLMDRDGSRPRLFVLLLGVALDSALILRFTDRLRKRIRQEVDVPWTRQYIDTCHVLDPHQWSTAFPNWPLRVASLESSDEERQRS